MRFHIVIALSLVIGVCSGAAISTVVRAQAKPPAYIVYQTQLTGDPAEYGRDYVAHVLSTLEPFGGRFLVRGGTATRIEGDDPLPRVSIIAFDNIEQAKAWYNSRAYQTLVPVRQRLMKTNSFYAEPPSN